MENTPHSSTEKLYQKNLELLHERKRMEQLLYSVSEAVIAIDIKYSITVFNNVAEHLIGKKFADVIGHDICDVIQLSNFDGSNFDIKKNCFTSQNTNVSGLILQHDKKKFFLNFSSVIVLSDNVPTECLITLTDVTNEKQLEQAKDDFISVASHELRTPMTIIKSYLWMLTAGKAGELNTKQLEYLYKATHSTQRMIDLINDTLNISRLEQGRVEYDLKKLPLVELVKDAISDFALKVQERNIYLTIEDPGKEYFVKTDKSKTLEIITNLVGNSVKFTRKGGITIKFEELENEIKVFVIDTGAGIDKYDQSNLFHKFGRLDNSYQTVAETGGTGLGLYIVKLYVEGLGGNVGVSSEGINRGTTLWFTLPKSF